MKAARLGVVPSRGPAAAARRGAELQKKDIAGRSVQQRAGGPLGRTRSLHVSASDVLTMRTSGILKVDGLKVKHPVTGEELARSVRFTCGPGDVVFVKGASGCGKSLLLRTLAGLEELVDTESRNLTLDGRTPAEVGGGAAEYSFPITGIFFSHYNINCTTRKRKPEMWRDQMG